MHALLFVSSDARAASDDGDNEQLECLLCCEHASLLAADALSVSARVVALPRACDAAARDGGGGSGSRRFFAARSPLALALVVALASLVVVWWIGEVVPSEQMTLW